MNYIDTVWEKRNLGVDSCQINVDRNDNSDEVFGIINNCNKDYVEVYVEPGNVDVIWKLEEDGFRFAEATIDIALTENTMVIPQKYLRFQDDVKYTESTEEEINTIIEDIKKGDTFVTDKITLNPRFGSKAAGKRYSLWMKDLLSNGAKCFSVKYKGNLTGFEVVKIDDSVFELCIGGILSDTKIPGAGVFVSIGRAKYINNSNIAKVKTTISSNNLSVLKLHEEIGFKVTRIRYLFVKNY